MTSSWYLSFCLNPLAFGHWYDCLFANETTQKIQVNKSYESVGCFMWSALCHSYYCRHWRLYVDAVSKQRQSIPPGVSGCNESPLPPLPTKTYTTLVPIFAKKGVFFQWEARIREIKKKGSFCRHESTIFWKRVNFCMYSLSFVRSACFNSYA